MIAAPDLPQFVAMLTAISLRCICSWRRDWIALYFDTPKAILSRTLNKIVLFVFCRKRRIPWPFWFFFVKGGFHAKKQKKKHEKHMII